MTSQKGVGLIVLIAVVVPLALAIKLSYSIAVVGKIVPAQEWVVVKGTDGRLH